LLVASALEGEAEALTLELAQRPPCRRSNSA
jgi:hypothetical protein